MVMNVKVREDAILEGLRQKYESIGYQFFAHPVAEMVPPFLGSYVPDAIAIGPKDKLIIEVKSRAHREQDRALNDIAKKVGEFPEWKFLVFFDSEASQEDAGVVTEVQLRDQINRVRTLMNTEDQDLAFIVAWATLEAALRLLRVRQARSTPRYTSPNQLVETLATEGLVDTNIARRLRDLVKQRNAIVHGEPTSEVERVNVFLLMQIIENVVELIRQT